MKNALAVLRFAATISAALTSEVSAHFIPWRAGETRVAGVGNCAKGPCLKRSDFSSGKPHRHVNGRIVFDSRSW